jgi:hypothetical protein
LEAIPSAAAAAGGGANVFVEQKQPQRTDGLMTRSRRSRCYCGTEAATDLEVV